MFIFQQIQTTSTAIKITPQQKTSSTKEQTCLREEKGEEHLKHLPVPLQITENIHKNHNLNYYQCTVYCSLHMSALFRKTLFEHM